MTIVLSESVACICLPPSAPSHPWAQFSQRRDRGIPSSFLVGAFVCPAKQHRGFGPVSVTRPPNPACNSTRHSFIREGCAPCRTASGRNVGSGHSKRREAHGSKGHAAPQRSGSRGKPEPRGPPATGPGCRTWAAVKILDDKERETTVDIKGRK